MSREFSNATINREIHNKVAHQHLRIIFKMMILNARISKTIVFLTLFFFLFNIPSSMAELERSEKVKKTVAEVKDEGTATSYGSLNPNHPVFRSPPGRPYNRSCRGSLYCRNPPHHLAHP